MNGLTLATPTDAGQAIWHVSLGVVDPMTGRRQPAELTGAWELTHSDVDLTRFTVGRLLLAGEDVETSLAELADEIGTVQDELQEAFDAWVATTKKSLVAPRWPGIPHLECAKPAKAHAPETMQAPLAYAMWARALLAVWRETEDQRVARHYLCQRDDQSVRDFPPRWAKRWCEDQ